MRTETITKTLATFEELSDERKEQEIENHRNWNVEHHQWWDFVYDDAKHVAKLLGFEIEHIYFNGFWSQGDGACFECFFSYEKGTLQKIKDYAPKDEELQRIASDLVTLHAKSFYTTQGRTRQSGHYNHEYSMAIDIDYEKGAENYDEWKEIIADFARWIYRNLEAEYTHLTSDETVSETLIANEVEFEV